jgi:hypothetical protein
MAAKTVSDIFELSCMRTKRYSYSLKSLIPKENIGYNSSITERKIYEQGIN